MMMKRQSGLTMISWMVVIGFIAIQAIMAMRIIPVYLDYSTVKSVMNGMAQDVEMKGMSAKNINSVFRKRLKINNLYDLSVDKDAFKFSKIKNGYQLKAKYEVRGPIWGNLNFLVDFEHEVDISIR